MNRQLIRLKRRSDDEVLNVDECDDSDNLYVNVAASTPIDIDGGTIAADAVVYYELRSV